MMEYMQVSMEVQETFKAENQKLFEASRAENQKLQATILSKINKELEATSGKLHAIQESVSRKITGVEERVSHLENTVDSKVDNLEKAVDGKLVMMEEKINNFQSQRPEQVRVISESTGRIKPPCFDDSSPLIVFKFQFETIVSRNGWDDEKALELILALKGVAAEILETMPASRSNNYDLMVACSVNSVTRTGTAWS